MGFATCGYTGDTATSGSSQILIQIPDSIKATTESRDAELLKQHGIFKKVCKKCNSPFDSLKKKAQICPQCKKKKHEKQMGL